MSKPYWVASRITVLVVGTLATLLWLTLAFLTMAVAWGARGEPKPVWFFVVIGATYLTPILGVASLVLGLTRLPRIGMFALIVVALAEILGIGLSLTFG